MKLKNFDPENFLRNYWQKKPLVIRQAFESFEQLIDPDELAGISCEEGSFSKIILEKNKKLEVMEGPFDPETYESTPESNWTLMVMEVDHWSETVAKLRDPFTFIPEWRMDDVSVSYAADSGTVGAHFDFYDVFIIQGIGRRRWQLESRARTLEECGPDHLVDGSDLKLVNDFHSSEEWILEEGDLLYIPPQWGHYGVSLGESISYSVGFRAPSIKEMVLSYVKSKLDLMSEDIFLEDPHRSFQGNSSEISALDSNCLVNWPEWLEKPSSNELNWFAELVTEPKRIQDLDEDSSDEEFSKEEIAHSVFVRNLDHRLAYFEENGEIRAYVDGKELSFARDLGDLIKVLFSKRELQGAEISKFLENEKALDLLQNLLGRGIFYRDSAD